MKFIAAAAVAVLLGACGSSGVNATSTRPTTHAQLLILSPTPNEVTGPDVTLTFQVIGGTVLAPAQVTGPLRGDQGHIHVSLDGKLVTMAYSTKATVTGLAPGSHSVQAAWVATDHLPFSNQVIADVLFQVRGNMTAAPERLPAAVAVVGVLIGVFVARPFFSSPAQLAVLFAVILIVGAGWPIVHAPRSSAPTVLGALVVGIATLAAGRVVGGLSPIVHARPSYVAGVVLAAVAEELFFRRLVYAVLATGGVPLAIGGSSFLFAVAHVTVYGWWVLPLDLAAGAVLGWQRWSTGTWTVPAATHVVANLLVVL